MRGVNFIRAVLLGVGSVIPIQAAASDAAQCLPYLRDIAYNETLVRTSSATRDSLRYAMCKSNFKSKSEAQKSGFGLGITLFDVPFEANGNLDSAKFETWKSTHCTSLSTDFSEDTEATTLIREVSPEVAKIFNACVSDSGLFCAISSPNPEVINVQLNWKPFPGSKAYTTLRSSTVVNAKSLEPRTPAGQLVPVKYIIPYGGVILQLHRSDVRRPVNVTVNTDNGACAPLSISAEGDVTAKVEISGTIEKSEQFIEARALEIQNTACGTTLTGTTQVCSADPIVNTTIDGENATCGYNPAQTVITENCANVTTYVNGCSNTIVRERRGKCYMEGINHSRPRRVCDDYYVDVPVCSGTGVYKTTVSISGTKWQRTPLRTIEQQKALRNGAGIFEYDNSPYGAGFRNPIYSYRATVTFPGPDGRPLIHDVTSAAPSKNVGNVKISSSLAPSDGSVIVLVEGVGSASSAWINQDYEIKDRQDSEVKSVETKSEELNLESVDTELMNSFNATADR